MYMERRCKWPWYRDVIACELLEGDGHCGEGKVERDSVSWGWACYSTHSSWCHLENRFPNSQAT